MASKSAPETPKNLQKCCTVVVFLVFASSGKIAPNIQKKSPRCSQKRAKLPLLSSKLANLDTSWTHLGAKLANIAPSWPQLGPS